MVFDSERNHALADNGTSERASAVRLGVSERVVRNEGALWALRDGGERREATLGNGPRKPANKGAWRGHCGVLQRAGGGRCEAPPDRRVRGDERSQRPEPALRDGEAAKEAVEAEGLEVVADKGYYNGVKIATCVEAELTPLVPRSTGSKNPRRRGFSAATAFPMTRSGTSTPARASRRSPAGGRSSTAAGRWASTRLGRVWVQDARRSLKVGTPCSRIEPRGPRGTHFTCSRRRFTGRAPRPAERTPL
jgi:hypothetical protein